MAPSVRRIDGPVSSVRLERCPECGGGRLTAVSDGGRTNFFCEDCALCWHVELGWVSRVNPGTCPGCSKRGQCLGRARPYGATG